MNDVGLVLAAHPFETSLAMLGLVLMAAIVLERVTRKQ